VPSTGAQATTDRGGHPIQYTTQIGKRPEHRDLGNHSTRPQHRQPHRGRTHVDGSGL